MTRSFPELFPIEIRPAVSSMTVMSCPIGPNRSRMATLSLLRPRTE